MHTLKNTPEVTGLILAGGESRRFGQDKATFSWQGRTMVEHVARVVRRVVAGPLLVSVRDGQRLVGLKLGDVRCVPDRYREAGPLAGLHTGLNAATTPWVLVVACDMPFVTTEALQALLEARTTEAHAVVAQDAEGRRHPLCACYPRRVLPVVEEQLESGRRACRALLDRLENVQTVDLPSEVLRNVNRPSDLMDAKRPSE